jgi:hypothetical protein
VERLVKIEEKIFHVLKTNNEQARTPRPEHGGPRKWKSMFILSLGMCSLVDFKINRLGNPQV